MAYNLKTPKKKKEEDLFAFKDESKSEKSEDLFSMKPTEEEYINDINEDLFSDDSKIKIKNKNTLLVNSDGKVHEISKQDIINYHERYRLEGQDGHDISGFRHLGSISGDYELIDQIYKDSNSVFNRIDEHSNSYKTIPSEED